MHRSLTLFVVILLITSCTQTPTQPNAIDLKKNQIPPPQQWEITAKLGIRVPDQSGSVSLTWQQLDTSYRIRVQGPLGQGSGIIYGNADRVVIKRPGKPLLSSSNAAGLIRETFGWEFPLNELKFWIRGMPTPNTVITSEKQNASGLLENLQQARWSMEYSRYQKVDQWFLPGKIVAQQGETRLTMIIRKWAIL